jgi:hypothetical protein
VDAATPPENPDRFYTPLMIRPWMRHLRLRDYRFLALVAIDLLAIGAYLAGGLALEQTPSGGWRHIDRVALERRIESGELQSREARWYRPVDVRGERR